MQCNRCPPEWHNSHGSKEGAAILVHILLLLIPNDNMDFDTKPNSVQDLCDAALLQSWLERRHTRRWHTGHILKYFLQVRNNFFQKSLNSTNRQEASGRLLLTDFKHYIFDIKLKAAALWTRCKSISSILILKKKMLPYVNNQATLNWNLQLMSELMFSSWLNKTNFRWLIWTQRLK